MQSKVETNCRCHVLEAETEKLISRYKESRRAHPLNENGQMSLMDSILKKSNC